MPTRADRRVAGPADEVADHMMAAAPPGWLQRSASALRPRSTRRGLARIWFLVPIAAACASGGSAPLQPVPAAVPVPSLPSVGRLGARAGAASNARPTPASTATPFQAGIASWYGPGFDGRPTASGEIFRADSLTAAHRELPFGTRVRVVDIESGREVVVRINDRGPFAGGDRIIDLSRAAAERLEILDAGLADVVLFVIQQAGDGGGTESGPDAETGSSASAAPHSIASSG